MKQISKKESGLAHIGIIIAAILVVAALAFASWWVWEKNHEKDTNNLSQSSQNQKEDENTTETTNQNESDNYLVIKEWGVRITLPEALRGDITYFINQKIYDDFGTVRLDLVSKRFSEGDLKCAVIEGGTPRSLVNVEKQVDGEGGETIEPEPFKRIGNARFYFAGSSCEEAINRQGSLQDKQLVSDLKKAVKETLEKVE